MTPSLVFCLRPWEVSDSVVESYASHAYGGLLCSATGNETESVVRNPRAMFVVSEKPDCASIEYTQAPMASLMGVLQIFGALFFSSYFFFWAFGLCGLIMSVQLNIISLRAACYSSAAYVTSIFVYKPHLARGWYFHWFLYGPFTDLVLGYYGSRCIREGPRLNPKQGYLFEMAPHGVFGVCRAFSGGQLWRRLFPQGLSLWSLNIEHSVPSGIESGKF